MRATEARSEGLRAAVSCVAELRAWLASLVDLAAVADAEDQDEESVVFDLVDDAVVAGPDSPLAGAANEPGCGWWSGFCSEQLKCCLDAAAYLWVELAELACGGRRQGDAVGHVRPRSALTCSHGIGVSPVACISARAAAAARMSAMSSASSRIWSRSSASMTAATRRPRRAK